VIRRTTPREGWSPSPVASKRRFRRFAFVLLVPILFGLLGGPAGNVTPAHGDELADARAKQAALAKQISNQKAEIAKINELQSELGQEITSTKQLLSGINADLGAVRKSIGRMVVRITAVKSAYRSLLGRLDLLDDTMARVEGAERRKRGDLERTKAELADRIRQAYDTNRTSLLETFLSGGTFTDVISEVGYINDVAEQDKTLADSIVRDQATLAALHETVAATKVATEDLRVQTEKTKALLDGQLVELKAAKARLSELEKQTARALAIQKRTYAQLLKNKSDLARALRTTAAARNALGAKINDLIAQQYAKGNIPSKYNGTLTWPMVGTVTQDFGCTGFAWEPPYGSCAHFHQGIDLVARENTKVRASGDGRIVYCGWNYADGADPAWIVIIAHSSNLETWYAHMQPVCPARAGEGVKAGQVIGFEGNTGHSTGAHLHWAVRQNGVFVNPRFFV
jgi:murein DD-endopeptidase MepM/ murein hydrolase activator NlpD